MLFLLVSSSLLSDSGLFPSQTVFFIYAVIVGLVKMSSLDRFLTLLFLLLVLFGVGCYVYTQFFTPHTLTIVHTGV